MCKTVTAFLDLLINQFFINFLKESFDIYKNV